MPDVIQVGRVAGLVIAQVLDPVKAQQVVGIILGIRVRDDPPPYLTLAGGT